MINKQKERVHNFHKLNEKVLQSIGFEDSGRDDLDRIKWRLKVPYYHFQIQVVLGDYHAANPNCGIVSLYSAPCNAVGFKQVKPTKKNPTGVEKETIHLKEREIAVAWYVNTPERLHAIIISLSQTNI